MKRTQDKIRDFVEAKAFEVVENYAGDLRHALAAYLFTDATSDLLARWLDALSDAPRGQGIALALAGLRGVGKSHLLAAFGALAAFPDVRGSINEPHVAASARRLLNRRYQVVYVERGTRPTLLEEIKVGLARALQISEAQWAENDIAALMAVAASRSDAPLVFIVDTAPGREARVKRDDGPLLAQMASVAKQLGVLVAAALDDDIAGADGINAAIVAAYRIDYLDPEHLYRITDLHLFQKNAHTRAALHELYLYLRQYVPGFNWSEPRFLALYPVHPLIADVASAVRLYSQNFAFLPFAASAGGRAVNRPALSLVVLDDVFDRAEYDLRQAGELADAFAAYDGLATEAITQVPIMQRLQAKLILKGLFILSLDGRGATARELCAAMLLYDEARPEAAVQRVTEWLTLFASALSAKAFVVNEDGAEKRYRFHIKAAAGFEEAWLEQTAALSVTPEDLATLWQVLARQRFSDWQLLDESGSIKPHAALEITWRGLARHILLSWHVPDAAGQISFGAAPSDLKTWPFDWEVALLAPVMPDHAPPQLALPDDATERLALWRPAMLTVDELETLRRLLMLRANPSFFKDFGEAARAAERTHAALAERIWTRLYLDEGKLVMGWTEFAFTADAKAAKTLDECLSGMLAPLLGARYPQHPIFWRNITESDVAQLVSGFFGAASATDPETQELVRLFAMPLGLATQRGAIYVLETSDNALKQPWLREIIALTDEADGAIVPLEVVYQKLRPAPYGLLRHLQHLILVALVAQRRIDLVTSTGDRIGRRTLDLRIRWDDIAGVARVESQLYTAEELTAWARLLTGVPKLAGIHTPETRQQVRAALAAWLAEWQAQGVLEKFDALPDEALTTKLWNSANAVRKSFGMTADALTDALAEQLTLEEGLQSVADAFVNSETAFARYTVQREQLAAFVEHWPDFAAQRAYLFQIESLNDTKLESQRITLITLLSDVHLLFDAESVARWGKLWPGFHSRYSELYARDHEATVGTKPPYLSEINALQQSAEWRLAETFAQLALFNHERWQELQHKLATLRREPCRRPVRERLMHAPVCGCGFRLADAEELNRAPAQLRDLLTATLAAYQATLNAWQRPLAYALEAFIAEKPDDPLADHARFLIDELLSGEPLEFSLLDLRLLEAVLQHGGAPPLRVTWPADASGLMRRDELAARVKQWLESLPNDPALLDVAASES